MHERRERGRATFPQLFESAYLGRLNGEVPRLFRTNVDNLLVLPPGTRIDVSPDGLPPLLQTLADADFDLAVIAAPASRTRTRRSTPGRPAVLWVMESGELTVEQAPAWRAGLRLRADALRRGDGRAGELTREGGSGEAALQQAVKAFAAGSTGFAHRARCVILIYHRSEPAGAGDRPAGVAPR